MELDHVRSEIEFMRTQVGRQRREILQASARRYLDGLGRAAANKDAGQDRRALHRARPAEERAGANEGACTWREEVVMGEPLRWYDDKADNPPWIDALAEVRMRATREGWCYPHVQAIIVAIDQYAEAALGNRSYFLNRPHRIG